MVQNKKDVNPEVKDDSTLEKTQEQVNKDLKNHSGFEQRTGVTEESIEESVAFPKPVVDADPGDGKTFSARTSATQPWAEYQAKAEEKRAEAEQRAQKENVEATKQDDSSDKQ